MQFGRRVTVAAVVALGPVLFAGVGIAAAATHTAVGSHSARPVTQSGTWGNAKQVPGLAALNAGGLAEIDSISCSSAGNCSAGGFYSDASRHLQAFVADETNGVWGTAEEVPGTAALNIGDQAGVVSVSCASPGNCSAGGFYSLDNFTKKEAFVVAETNGVWGTAEEVPGLAALNVQMRARVNAVSCASAGNCTAVGVYSSHRGGRAFGVIETDGTWGTAKRLPGLSVLTQGHGTEIANSVSCGSVGNCGAAGTYPDGSGAGQAFVVAEVHGHWQPAIEVPGSAALNVGGSAAVTSVSCASAGNCGAGGFYTDSSARLRAFAVTETKGAWGTAEQVAGTGSRTKIDAQIDSVSCTSAGTCRAAGTYRVLPGGLQGFTVSENNGTWGTASQIPGLAALNTDQIAGIGSVSCASAADCSTGGFYDASLQQAFVASRVNGRWGTAQEVPGTNALNTDFAAVSSVSCGAVGNCGAGGFYTDSSGARQAFVVNES